jgi:zinc protease
MLNRYASPEYREIDKFEIIKAESSYLDNGIPFHLIKAGNESVIRLEIIFKAGHWEEPFNGISFFTTKLLSAGTSKISAKEIEEKIALYGAFIDLAPGLNRTTLTIYTLSKHLINLIPLIQEIIIGSTFPEKEIENLKNITSQNLKVNLKKTSYIASKIFRKLLFGEDHPYGRTLDEEAITAVNQETLKVFHKNYFTSKNCDIILSGNGSEDFFKIINNYLGSVSWGSFEEGEKKYAFKTPGHTAELVQKKDSVQSSIRIGMLLFPISHPDYFKMNLLIEIFGGYFGSRLMKNIREEKGYTYGISAGFSALKTTGYMTIGTDVNKENTANTVKEIYHELKVLKSELVDEDELLTVKNYLLGSFVSSLSTPFGLADKFKTIYFKKLGYGFYDDYIQSLKTISSQDLLETANKYFDERQMIEVVVGDK